MHVLSKGRLFGVGLPSHPFHMEADVGGVLTKEPGPCQVSC